MRRPGGLVLALLMCSGALPLFVSPASAVPAFARRYGVACSTCHDAWPHLNPTGMSFKMSGYRRLNGADLQPTTKDMELAVGALQIPSIPPLAIRLTTGFDWRRDHRTASDGSRAGQTGSSLDLVAAVRDRAPKTNVVMTGRDAPDGLIEVADTVTEMRKVKHAYDQGIKALKGIEY